MGEKPPDSPIHFGTSGWRALIADQFTFANVRLAVAAIAGHVCTRSKYPVLIVGPEKDGILACLLVAEMIAARRAPLGEQLKTLFTKVGGDFWPIRENLHLGKAVKARTVARLRENFPEFQGRRVSRVDRTDGLKLIFADGSWLLLRLSGTEPLLRVYAEAATMAASRQIAADAAKWIEA